MRQMIVCMVIVAYLLFRSAGLACAGPTTPDCADPTYRQAHLQDCNAKHDQWAHGGGSGPRGLLGLGGIGGIL